MNSSTAASDFIKFFVVVSILQSIVKASPVIKFTGVNCEVLDKSYGEFTKCELKAISRSKSIVSVSFKLAKTVTECVIRAQLMRKASGWRPFLYNMKFNACDFLKRPKKYIIQNIAWDLMRPYTNVNHSCPYESGEELKLMKFEMDTDFFKRFPTENGEYAVSTKWYSENRVRVVLNGSISYMDYNNKNKR